MVAMFDALLLLLRIRFPLPGGWSEISFVVTGVVGILTPVEFK